MLVVCLDNCHSRDKPGPCGKSDCEAKHSDPYHSVFCASTNSWLMAAIRLKRTMHEWFFARNHLYSLCVGCGSSQKVNKVLQSYDYPDLSQSARNLPRLLISYLWSRQFSATTIFRLRHKVNYWSRKLARRVCATQRNTESNLTRHPFSCPISCKLQLYWREGGNF